MFDNICEVICAGERINFIDVKRNDRSLEIVYPRQLIMYFAKEFKALPSDRLIGEPFGKDHTTVISASKSIKNYIDTDKVKREQIENYRKKITGIKDVITHSEKIKKELQVLVTQLSNAEQRMVSLQLNVNEVRALIEKYNL